MLKTILHFQISIFAFMLIFDFQLQKLCAGTISGEPNLLYAIRKGVYTRHGLSMNIRNLKINNNRFSCDLIIYKKKSEIVLLNYISTVYINYYNSKKELVGEERIRIWTQDLANGNEEQVNTQIKNWNFPTPPPAYFRFQFGGSELISDYYSIPQNPPTIQFGQSILQRLWFPLWRKTHN